MFSKELRRKIFLKYNIEERCLNTPIHYRIPSNLGDNPYLLYNNSKEQKLKKKISKISSNITKYSRNKENNIKQIKDNIQKNKIDIIFNKTYYKTNNNIRKSDGLFISKDKIKEISNISKEKIKNDLMNKKRFYDSIFKKEYHRNIDRYFLDKQYTWSKTFLEQKQIKKYKNLYKIEYIDTMPSFPQKIYCNYKYKRDKTIPKIIKLNSSNKSFLFNKRTKLLIKNIKFSIDQLKKGTLYNK
jgi:hypothetical protein